MGIEAEFIRGARAIFAAAGDALTAVTYHVAPTGGSDSYTPATGTAAVTPDEEISLDGVFFYDFDDEEIDGVRIREKDQKVLIEAAKLITSAGVDVTPKLSDWIEEGTTRWEIKRDLSPKAVRAYFELHVRTAG
jgi:hypothetical protein